MEKANVCLADLFVYFEQTNIIPLYNSGIVCLALDWLGLVRIGSG